MGLPGDTPVRTDALGGIAGIFAALILTLFDPIKAGAG